MDLWDDKGSLWLSWDNARRFVGDTRRVQVDPIAVYASSRRPSSQEPTPPESYIATLIFSSNFVLAKNFTDCC